jgi:FemAB-related protein (PEP-CTERM system-associated)
MDKRASMDNRAPEIDPTHASLDDELAGGNSAITVKRFKSVDAEKWDHFVFSSPDATFFHLAAWKTIIETAFRHRAYYFYAEKKGELKGVLPLIHLRSVLFGNGLISLPFCAYGGIMAQSEKARIALEEEAIALAERLNVGYIEMRNLSSRHKGWPQKDLYVTFRKSIDPDPDKNFAAIPRKQRAMVRKGIKAGLVSEVDEDTSRFYDAYSKSVHSLGTPVFSKKYFALLKEAFGDQCQVLTITKSGRTVSSVLSFYFKDEVLPYYGGGVPEARALSSNDFMYWELMRRASEGGVKIFDYGRSKKDTGSYRFKKHWGFEPQPLFYEYHLVKDQDIPDISPVNPRYQYLIKLWQCMPLAVSRLVGPPIARNLG